MVNRKSILVLSQSGNFILLRSIVLCFILLIAVPMVSSAGWDNWKTSINTNGNSFNVGNRVVAYNPIWDTYEPIEIKNLQSAVYKIKTLLEQRGISCSV